MDGYALVRKKNTLILGWPMSIYKTQDNSLVRTQTTLRFVCAVQLQRYENINITALTKYIDIRRI